MIERVKTGVPGMDEMLKGGFLKGRTILVSGACGTGKTIFCSQFVKEGLKNKEKALYVTFEQEKERMIQDLSEVGIDMEKEEKEGLLRIIGGPLAKVRRFKERTKADIKDLTDEIREIIKESGIKRVVIDSLNLFTMLFESDFQKRIALAALSSSLEDLDCTSLFISEVREGSNDLSGHGFEEFIVDGVIFMQRLEKFPTFVRSISVIKMRGTDHSCKKVPFAIRIGGINVYPKENVVLKS